METGGRTNGSVSYRLLGDWSTESEGLVDRGLLDFSYTGVGGTVTRSGWSWDLIDGSAAQA